MDLFFNIGQQTECFGAIQWRCVNIPVHVFTPPCTIIIITIAINNATVFHMRMSIHTQRLRDATHVINHCSGNGSHMVSYRWSTLDKHCSKSKCHCLKLQRSSSRDLGVDARIGSGLNEVTLQRANAITVIPRGFRRLTRVVCAQCYVIIPLKQQRPALMFVGKFIFPVWISFIAK